MNRCSGGAERHGLALVEESGREYTPPALDLWVRNSRGLSSTSQTSILIPMRNLPDNRSVGRASREISRAMQACAEANAALWVSSFTALNELSLSVAEQMLGTFDNSENPRRTRNRTTETDASSDFGRALFDVGSAVFRAADVGSEVLRRSLTDFYDRYTD